MSWKVSRICVWERCEGIRLDGLGFAEGFEGRAGRRGADQTDSPVGGEGKGGGRVGQRRGKEERGEKRRR